jgi:hypothetical protein
MYRPFRRSRHRGEYGIKMNFRETGWEGVEKIYLGPVVGFCEHDYERSGSGTTELVS